MLYPRVKSRRSLATLYCNWRFHVSHFVDVGLVGEVIEPTHMVCQDWCAAGSASLWVCNGWMFLIPSPLLFPLDLGSIRVMISQLASIGLHPSVHRSAGRWLLSLLPWLRGASYPFELVP